MMMMHLSNCHSEYTHCMPDQYFQIDIRFYGNKRRSIEWDQSIALNGRVDGLRVEVGDQPYFNNNDEVE